LWEGEESGKGQNLQGKFPTKDRVSRKPIDGMKGEERAIYQKKKDLYSGE